MKKQILVIDDQLTTLHQFKRSLQQNGYEVFVSQRGKEALDFLAAHKVDLVLLYLKLPDISGQQVCEEIRSMYSLLPIIIISIKTDVPGKVQALHAGADDYISKPFNMIEVLARIEVQLRHMNRMRSERGQRIFIDKPLEINFEQRSVKVNNQQIDLTYTEYELLRVLVHNHDNIVSYDIILSQVWGDGENSDRQYIHVYINRLRQKIETLAQRRFIFNEPKVGYRFQTSNRTDS